MRLFFMAHQHNPAVELPDRKEITLCEAITAVIYGEARTSMRIYEELISKGPVIINFSEEQRSDEQTDPDEELRPNQQRITTKQLRLCRARQITRHQGGQGVRGWA
jgi:hypothetical protein